MFMMTHNHIEFCTKVSGPEQSQNLCSSHGVRLHFDARENIYALKTPTLVAIPNSTADLNNFIIIIMRRLSIYTQVFLIRIARIRVALLFLLFGKIKANIVKSSLKSSLPFPNFLLLWGVFMKDFNPYFKGT